jgi:hypothetical protein
MVREAKKGATVLRFKVRRFKGFVNKATGFEVSDFDSLWWTKICERFGRGFRNL